MSTRVRAEKHLRRTRIGVDVVVRSAIDDCFFAVPPEKPLGEIRNLEGDLH